MIPVYQTMTVGNDGCGNCFNACVASIMELPLRYVAQIHPNFDGDWTTAWEDWFAERGLMLKHHSGRGEPPKGYALACGKGGRQYPEGHKRAGEDIYHAVVVFNGELVHDPYPGGKGIDRARYWETIEPISETYRQYLDARDAA